MSYIITGRGLQAFRRCVNDLAGLINGRNDVPAQFHTDVEQAREALEGARESHTDVASAPMPAAAAAAAAPIPEENS